ncbi:YugN family protein [Desmospora activa]|uniref:YugN-like protein n=1 Tax=Desmospora activa DSM 45169 TaxID=1121389 RepID=A0A2T4ZDE7_9BACL|nr:YugN family protein [Desmospora activa]PTM59907.1 YugN-like protein [Desmospora activa DSM 45169]
MLLTDAGLKGITGEFGHVDQVMHKAGFDRGGAWDYNKASFDMRLEGKDSAYYLRVQSHVIEGVLESPKAKVQLEDPVFLRHIFPHGLDPDTEIPTEFQETINKAIQQVKKELG